MPLAEVTFVGRHSRPRRFHGRFGANMRNDHVIPCIAVLMAKNNEMIRHWVAAIRRFKPIAQLHCFAESGLGEVDMINVASFTSPSGRRAAGSGLWRSLAVNERTRQQAK